MTRLLSAGACAAAIVLATSAPASALVAPSAYVQAFADDFVDTPCNTGNVSGATANCSAVYSQTTPVLSGNATSDANAPDGAVRATAVSTNYYFNGAAGQAFATSTLSDVLTFHGPLSGDAVITMTGTITLTPDFTNHSSNGHEFGFTEAYMGLEGVDSTGQEIAQATYCSPGASTTFCSPLKLGNAVISNVGTTFTITETFNLAADPVLGVSFFAGAETVGDGTASVVDPITVKLPPGVTFTSASGLFLTHAGVPEPAAWTLLIAGLGAVGAAGRLRRAAQAT